jgi:hypothetical protein
MLSNVWNRFLNRTKHFNAARLEQAVCRIACSLHTRLPLVIDSSSNMAANISSYATSMFYYLFIYFIIRFVGCADDCFEVKCINCRSFTAFTLMWGWWIGKGAVACLYGVLSQHSELYGREFFNRWTGQINNFPPHMQSKVYCRNDVF